MHHLVAAVGDARVTLPDPRTGAADGSLRRALPREEEPHAVPDGETVNDHLHYRRAIARAGDLQPHRRGVP